MLLALLLLRENAMMLLSIVLLYLLLYINLCHNLVVSAYM